MPPRMKNTIVVTRYITPIRLWSSVKAQERQPRSERYPRPSRPSAVTESFPSRPHFSVLEALHDRVDVLRRKGSS